MSEELKPCPFCGSDASLYVHDVVRTPFVQKTKAKIECDACQIEIYDIGMSGNRDDVLATVIKKWNTRACDV